MVKEEEDGLGSYSTNLKRIGRKDVDWRERERGVT